MFISIQYLRAIAAIFVVIFHLFGSKGGEQGVGLFFVLSGFIMFYLIDVKYNNWKIFLKARVTRVVPLYWIMTTLTLLLGVAYDPTLTRIITSYSFLAIGTVLPVGWTLSYEFIFYISCAFILYAFYHKPLYYKYLALLLLLILGDILLSTILYRVGFPNYGHHFLLFGLGGISYILYTKTHRKISRNILILLILINFVILFMYDSGQTWVYVLGIGIPSMLILYAIVLLEKFHSIPKNNFLLLLGASSYSLYLTHYILLHTLEIENKYFMFLLCILVGILSYKILEQPLLRFLKKNF